MRNTVHSKSKFRLNWKLLQKHSPLASLLLPLYDYIFGALYLVASFPKKLRFLCELTADICSFFFFTHTESTKWISLLTQRIQARINQVELCEFVTITTPFSLKQAFKSKIHGKKTDSNARSLHMTFTLRPTAETSSDLQWKE